MSASRDEPDGVGYDVRSRATRPNDVGPAAQSTRKLGQAEQRHRRPSEQLLAARVEGHIHSTPVLTGGVHAAVLQHLHGRLGVLRRVGAGVGC